MAASGWANLVDELADASRSGWYELGQELMGGADSADAMPSVDAAMEESGDQPDSNPAQGRPSPAISLEKFSSAAVLQTWYDPGIGEQLAVMEAWVRQAGDSSPPDPQILALSKFFYGSSSSMHTSKEAISQLTQVPSEKVEPHLNLLSSILWEADRHSHSELIRGLLNSKAAPIAFIDFCQYDETPMKVTHLVPSTATASTVPESTVVSPEAGPVGSAGPNTLAAPAPVGGKAATTSKLFAAEHQYALLMDLSATTPGPAIPEASRYLCLHGSHLGCIQVLDRASADCMLPSLLRTSCIPEHIQEVPLKIRVCTTDKGSANFTTEQLLSDCRGADWARVHLPCCVHTAANIHTKSLLDFQEHVSGVLNMALYLRLGEHMSRFRASLLQLLQEKVTLMRGHPTLEMINYREWCLSLLCHRGPQAAVKALMLRNLANGDWTRGDQVQLIIPPGPAIDEGQAKEQVVQGLLKVLAGRLLRLYPQHRWLGAEAAVDDVALMECCHHLASSAFQHMMAGVQKVAVNPTADAGHLPSMALEEAEIQGPEADPNVDVGTVRAEGPAAAVPDPGFLPPAADHAEQVQASATWQAINHKRASVASNWLRNGPLPQLLSLRLCLGPLCELLGSYLERSGHAWSLKQRREAARASTQSTVPGDAESPAPTSALRERAGLVSEKAFYKKLAELLLPQSWKHIPRSCWTLQFQATLFRTTSRMGCLVHELLAQPAMTYPLKLFAGSSVGAEVAQLSTVKECVLDPFSKALVAHLAAAPSQSSAAAACVETVGNMASTDIVKMEWSHGRAHRVLLAQSAHTHTPTLGYLNSQVMAQKYKARLQHLTSSQPRAEGLWRDKQATAPPTTSGAASIPKKGGGGAWRAFTSQRSRGAGERPDWSQLAEEYRQAKEDHTAEFQQAQQLGQAAASRHREGHQAKSSFGPYTRDVGRRERERGPALFGGFWTTAAEPEARNPAAETTTEQEALVIRTETQVSQLRGTARRQAIAKAGARRQEQKWLDQLVEEQQALVLSKLAQTLPSFQPYLPSLHLMPMVTPLTMQICPRSIDSAVEIAAAVANKRKHGSWHQALQQLWANLNTVVTPQQQQPTTQCEASAAEAPRKATPCCGLGVCVCEGHNKLAYHCMVRLVKALKRLAPRGDEQARGELTQGFVCLKLQMRRQIQSRTGWSALAEDPDESEHMHTAEAEPSKWIHIGLQYLKPYRPTFQVLELLDQPAPAKARLQQSGVFKTAFQLARDLDLTQSWSVEKWVVISTGAPVVQLDARHCLVSQRPQEAEVFWPPPPRKRRAPTRAQRRPKRRASQLGGEELEGPSEAGPAQGPAQPPGDADREQEEVEESMQPDSMELDSLSTPDEESEDLTEGVEEMLAVLEEQVLQQQRLQPADEGDAVPDEDMHSEGADDDSQPGEEQPTILEEAAADTAAEPAPTGPPPPVEANRPPSVAGERRQPDAYQMLGMRLPAEVTLEVPGGRVTYYRLGQFTATCTSGHGRCVMTRSALPGRRVCQGRPLGFLVKWLEQGMSLRSKAEHWNQAAWPDQESRLQKRRELEGMVGGPELLSMERTPREGEGPEPLELP